MDYLVLAFYLIKPLKNPRLLIQRFKEVFDVYDIMGRVYINEEGINAQMSIVKTEAPIFFDWYLGNEHFKDTDIKIHHYHKHVFPKKTVKYRDQLVALDQNVDYSKRGRHVSGKQWKEMLDEKDTNTVILDIRNDYEWEVGHFEGSKKPNFNTFREFPDSVKQLTEAYDPKKTRLLMYCTGGIRCELYSCLMKNEGYDEVYQLNGGVIKYGQEVGNDHWKGSLFVFDERLVVPISEKEENEKIGECRYCQAKTDAYYNCANMDCNALFLCCINCCQQFLGCCSSSCMEAPRCRKSIPQKRPKPFCKLSFEEKQTYSEKER